MLIELSRQNIIIFVNVILRVPALFIAEIWCRHDPSLFNFNYQEYISDGREQLIINVVYNLGNYFASVLTVLLTV